MLPHNAVKYFVLYYGGLLPGPRRNNRPDRQLHRRKGPARSTTTWRGCVTRRRRRLLSTPRRGLVAVACPASMAWVRRSPNLDRSVAVEHRRTEVPAGRAAADCWSDVQYQPAMNMAFTRGSSGVPGGGHRRDTVYEELAVRIEFFRRTRFDGALLTCTRWTVRNVVRKVDSLPGLPRHPLSGRAGKPHGRNAISTIEAENSGRRLGAMGKARARLERQRAEDADQTTDVEMMRQVRVLLRNSRNSRGHIDARPAGSAPATC